jgi:hypothetical protein
MVPLNMEITDFQVVPQRSAETDVTAAFSSGDIKDPAAQALKPIVTRWSFKSPSAFHAAIWRQRAFMLFNNNPF